MKKELEILEEEIDPDVLEQMPEWFKRLRTYYREKLTLHK